MNRNTSKIAILGAGRMGSALHRSLANAGRPSTLLSRQQTEREVRESISSSEVVFLCVPDARIASVAQHHADAFHPGQLVAHCAGALTLAELAHAAARGADVGSMHPLCAIASPETSLVGVHAAIAGSDSALTHLRKLAQALEMVPFEVRDADRARYHAAAALAANGLMALTAQSAELLTSCGLDSKQALTALLPLMRSALVALDRRGLPDALTGPIARGDEATIERHLASLSRPNDALIRTTYRALSQTLVTLSSAPPEALDAIAASLDDIDRKLP
ncbi:MAG: DUF2520 domain-containing protein [Myxococcales bacterium]|jgi:predicted short-subunit dehydrogenase-like oxidoreductase (DUF2520 family)|nr:DUF2520 domain-containing protein [Myxococcales bacterium]